MEKTNNKIYYLEGIRGLAALLVFFHHFLLAFYPAYYSYNANEVHLHNWEIIYGQSLFSVLSNGNFYVRVFFVLSGYVLSRKYFRANELSYVVSGVQRRFIRLYIPVAVTTILAFTLMQGGFFFNVPVSAISHSEWWLGNMWVFPDPVKRLFQSLTYSTMFLGDNLFDTSIRTMATEFYGSMLVYAFLALTHNTKSRFTMLVLLFLYCCFTGRPVIATFIFGIGLNYIEKLRSGFNKYLAVGIVIVSLPVALVLGAYPPDVAEGTFFSYFPPAILVYFDWFHTIGAFLLVMSFVISSGLQHLISRAFFRFLGFVSFSFYLLHPLVIGSFSSYIFLVLYSRFGYNHSVAIVFVLTIGLCMMLSWLMAKYVDVPSVKLAKYVYNRFWKKMPVAKYK